MNTDYDDIMQEITSGITIKPDEASRKYSAHPFAKEKSVMNFYVAYNIQADFPGAEVHNDRLEVYPNGVSFLNALKDYVRYVRFLALDNDPDRIGDNPWEEEFFQEYIKMIDEKLADSEFNQQLDLENFDVYDVKLSISIATSNHDTFFQYVSSYMSEIFGSDCLMDSGDEDDENIDDEDESGQDEEDGDFFSDKSLMEYCGQIAASCEKPDPEIVERFIDDYMACINSEAFSLVEAQKIDGSVMKVVEEKAMRNATKRQQTIEEKNRKV